MKQKHRKGIKLCLSVLERLENIKIESSELRDDIVPDEIHYYKLNAREGQDVFITKDTDGVWFCALHNNDDDEDRDEPCFTIDETLSLDENIILINMNEL